MRASSQAFLSSEALALLTLTVSRSDGAAAMLSGPSGFSSEAELARREAIVEVEDRSTCSWVGKSFPNHMSPKTIAVLGGGLTGLSAAFHLSRRCPAARITVYDADARFGGWVRSERVPVAGASVLLEAGPRTLRPNSRGVLELVGIGCFEPSSSYVAKIRFISSTYPLPW